jgi:hypothetical protein
VAEVWGRCQGFRNFSKCLCLHPNSSSTLDTPTSDRAMEKNQESKAHGSSIRTHSHSHLHPRAHTHPQCPHILTRAHAHARTVSRRSLRQSCDVAHTSSAALNIRIHSLITGILCHRIIRIIRVECHRGRAVSKVAGRDAFLGGLAEGEAPGACVPGRAPLDTGFVVRDRGVAPVLQKGHNDVRVSNCVHLVIGGRQYTERETERGRGGGEHARARPGTIQTQHHPN